MQITSPKWMNEIIDAASENPPIYATLEKHPDPDTGIVSTVDMTDTESIERFVRLVGSKLCEHGVTVTKRFDGGYRGPTGNRTFVPATYTIRLDDGGGAYGRDNTATIDANDSDFNSMAAKLYRVGIYVTTDIPTMDGDHPTSARFAEWCERQNAGDITTETIEYATDDW